MNRFNAWWVRGWVAIGLLAVFYEGAAFVNETWGNATLPTLSTILVTLIPLPLLEFLTVLIALVLCWHWYDLNKKKKAETSTKTNYGSETTSRTAGRMRYIGGIILAACVFIYVCIAARFGRPSAWFSQGRMG